MTKKYSLILITAGVVFILLIASLFTVDETKKAIILQFGKPVKIIHEPGLYIKIPFLQTARFFEDRIIEYDSAPTEIVTKDKKNLVIDNYARWRIIDPLKFMQAVRDENGAQRRLEDIVYSELRVELGKYDLNEIVALKRDTIMEEVTKRSNEMAQEYGISIVDVRIKRADLPEENEKAVFDRMRAERLRQANQYRSEGAEEALMITAQTDKEKVIILANAYKIAETNRGEGDAIALKIYADAFQKDPAFFRFVRTLEAYTKTLNNNTTIVTSTETDFFRLLDKIK